MIPILCRNDWNKVRSQRSSIACNVRSRGSSNLSDPASSTRTDTSGFSLRRDARQRPAGCRCLILLCFFWLGKRTYTASCDIRRRRISDARPDFLSEHKQTYDDEVKGSIQHFMNLRSRLSCHLNKEQSKPLRFGGRRLM